MAGNAETQKRMVYRHPLLTRYASREMATQFAENTRYTTWRKLWVGLAQAEMELGLTQITQEKLDGLRAKVDDIDYVYCDQMEKKLRHDVMAHVHAFGHQVPDAMGIIHLGATSCYITDNADAILIRSGCQILERKMLKLMSLLANFCKAHRAMPTMGYTHLQPAQLTTVGKRATLWLQDLLFDYEDLRRERENFKFRGVKGTTGTQASFLKLFENDHKKVKQLDKRVTELFDFKESVRVAGQTYTRKQDCRVLDVLARLGTSAHKMCTDIRLLASIKEIEEPFGKNQIGSSAMAYKRNPMRSERCCGLARYLMGLPPSLWNTHATQWMERTLDDSAIRRMVIPEAFLCADAILDILSNIVDGLQVWDQVIHKHIMAELPFMATENIIMECVKAGGDRQALHESIRVMSMEAGKRVKMHGEENDLLERIAKDKTFEAVHGKLDSVVDPVAYIGRAPEQVDEFLDEAIFPLLKETESQWKNHGVAELKV